MERRALLIGIGASCASALSAQRSRSAAAAVQVAVRNYYSIWNQGDVSRYRTLVTDDYILLEHGERMALADDLKMMPKPGASQRTDAFDFRATEIVGEVAYAHWFLESKVIDEKGTRERRWLESGVLRRSQGAWKIALLHSTRIENK